MSDKRDELAALLRSKFESVIREADEWRPLAQFVLDRLAEHEAFRQRVVEVLATGWRYGNEGRSSVCFDLTHEFRLKNEVEARLAELREGDDG